MVRSAVPTGSPGGAPARSVLKFLVFSSIGIVVFFVRIKIGGSSGIPIDHMVGALKRTLSPFYLYILTALSACSVLSRLRRKPGKDLADIFFYAMVLIGFALSLLAVLHILPEGIDQTVLSAVNATGNIVCAIFVTAVFIPFLTEYGLVDFFSVLCRPIMRKVFLTPGSSAVIGVSAFLGNYSVGHVVSRRMYDEGRFTEKEAVIVATGFSTCSIGLMINLVNYMDLMDHWHVYVVTVLIVTFLTTAIMARIYPICKKSDAYKEGTVPVEETAVAGNILLNAFHAGVSRASQASPPAVSAVGFLKQTLPVVCEITGTSLCVITVGMLCTGGGNLFTYLGYIFVPILRAVGVDSASAAQAGEALAISILEPVLAGVTGQGSIGSPVAQWIVSVVPYSAIVFFAGFIPSLRKSGIHCGILELMVIWLIRVAVGIVLTAGSFYLFAAAGLL